MDINIGSGIDPTLTADVQVGDGNVPVSSPGVHDKVPVSSPGGHDTKVGTRSSKDAQYVADGLPGAGLKGGPSAPSLPPPGDGKLGDMNDQDLSDGILNAPADLATVMLLYVKLAEELRTTNQLDRQTEAKEQCEALDASAQDIRAAAASRFTAACIQAAFQIGSGVVAIAGAGMSAKGASNASKGAEMETNLAIPKPVCSGEDIEMDDMNAPPGTNIDSQRSSMMNSTYQRLSQTSKLSSAGQGLSASAPIFQGLGGMAAASYELDASNTDADKARQDKLAAQYQSQRDLDEKRIEDDSQTVSDIRHALAAIQQSNSDANRDIANKIG